jgi:predicted Fe-S protein YdhL (DUF1289 family)
MRRFCRRIAFYGCAMTFQYRAVLSPCIGICSIDDDGLCGGCHRTGDEIAAWSLMNDDVRLRLMEDVLPQRAAKRGLV